MWNYIKYVLRLYIGAMIIVALNTILKLKTLVVFICNEPTREHT
jgi:hypothetical protein